jgi:AIPR protein
VSRGAEKNFVEFMAELMDGRPKLPDEIYFRHLVALAILFRQSERIVQSQKFGGYRANIVTYSLAWLSHNTAQRLDLDRIWKSQAVPQPLEESIRVIAKAAYDHLVDGAQGGNVTEWAKKERCWETFRTSGIPLSENMTASMLIDQPTGGVNTSAGHHDSPVKANVPTEVHFRTAEDWFGIARWAKETANLQPWQRSLAYSLGKIVERGKEPSSKQVQQGIKILSEAERLGFRFDSA